MPRPVPEDTIYTQVSEGKLLLLGEHWQHDTIGIPTRSQTAM